MTFKFIQHQEQHNLVDNDNDNDNDDNNNKMTTNANKNSESIQTDGQYGSTATEPATSFSEADDDVLLLDQPQLAKLDHNNNDDNNNNNNNNDDNHWIAQADAEIQEECLLAAARLLRLVRDPSKLTKQHEQVLQVAQDMETYTDDLLREPDDSWTKQSQVKSASNNDDNNNHNKKTNHSPQRDTSIYYKVHGARLECRVDCLVESSLLVPLLSVLNETDLYATWIPSWTVPVTLGIRQSKQLKQISKGHQIVHITCNVPWPLSARDVVLRATAVDDISAHDAIVIRMKSVPVHEDATVPEPRDSVVRADFEGAILIRPTSTSTTTTTQTKIGKDKNDQDTEEETKVMMVSFKMFMDPHLTFLPASIINFVTRTVIGTMWNMLLHVAEGVREGNRPLHAEAIQKRPDLYQWVKSRIQVLLEQSLSSTNNVHRSSSSTLVDDGEEKQKNGHEQRIACLQSQENYTTLGTSSVFSDSSGM